MAPALLVLEAVVLGVVVVLVAGLLRSHGEVLARLHRLERDRGPAGGATTPLPLPGPARRPRPRGVADPGPAPSAVEGVTLGDEAVSLALHPGRPDTVLAFLSASCATCRPFWAGLPGAAASLPGGPRVVVVTVGPRDESPARLRQVAPEGATVVMSSEAWEGFAVPGAPYFVWVDGAGGRIRGEGTGRGWPEVGALMADAAGDQAGRRGRADSDDELARAGFFPGDPRLHPAPGSGTGS
ncbi:MAG TPA: hypothetical protein VFO65_12005 [Acidimicrobiales bacterium]|nr:hypothetical protein [Acidimicrobiales bacterium]